MKRLGKLKMLGMALLGSVASSTAASAHKAQANDVVEVAFVLDTTGSMGGLIDGAKRKIWSIANTIVDINPDADIRMALIGYRDFGDDYVVKKFDMSADIQNLYGNLTRFNAQGGGDTPEAVNEALHEAVKNLTWSDHAKSRKIVFLVGDAPPHMDYQGPKYPQIVKTAKNEHIIVNTVQAGDLHETTHVWKEIAQHGNGEYISLPQDGGRIVIIETPYDDDIIRLQKAIDETVVPYGNQRSQRRVKALLESKSGATADTAVGNAKFYSKRTRSKEAITGGGDLIGDIRNGKQELSKVDEKQLPKEWQKKSAAERQALADQLVTKRKRLENKMAEIVKKHDDYVTKQSAEVESGGKSSFDRSVSKVLTKQLSTTY